jgi:hypothetical protein
MKASIFYRMASVLIVLFAVGHTVGFRKSDPQWRVDALLASMKSIQFDTQGFNRTYWDFFTGFGLFVSVFLVLAALLAWQLGGLSPSQLGDLRVFAWALAICFVGVTILSWRYFFLIPIVFSAVISLLLIAAAWLSPKVR